MASSFCNLDDQQISKSAVAVDQDLVLLYYLDSLRQYACQKLHRLFDALSHFLELLRLRLLISEAAPTDCQAFQDLPPMMSNARPTSDNDRLYHSYRSLKQRRVGCSKWCSQNASQQGQSMLDSSISHNSIHRGSRGYL